MRRAAQSLAVVLAVFLAGCAGTKPVTVGGVPAVDAVLVGAANRIDQAETVFTTAGEVLLGARSLIPDARWDQIADYSQAIEDALFLARDAMQAYQAVQSDETAEGLTKAISVLEFLTRKFEALATEEP